MSDSTTVCGVRLTHPDKVLYPEQGLTKKALAIYYERVGDAMLPFVRRRPLTLVRCPDGRQGPCFFQKHYDRALPGPISRTPVREKSGLERDYIVLRSVSGLVATAQVGALELHIWGSRCDRLERPDRIVFDLDPDEALSFGSVRAAALELRDVLSAAKLKSYALLTGGKGIHVIVPVRRTRAWDDIKTFAKGIAEQLAYDAPDRYIAKASRAARAGLIYIDWLRNERGATAIAPWSVRARAGAPVATPVSWNELDACESARTFTLANINERLRNRGEVWSDYSVVRQSLTNAHMASLRPDDRGKRS